MEKPKAKRSPHWPALEKKFRTAYSKCAGCGMRKTLAVHHIHPVHLFPQMELVWSNLITLCHRCHFLIGHLDDWKSWNPDVAFDAYTWASKIAKRSYVK